MRGSCIASPPLPATKIPIVTSKGSAQWVEENHHPGTTIPSVRFRLSAHKVGCMIREARNCSRQRVRPRGLYLQRFRPAVGVPRKKRS